MSKAGFWMDLKPNIGHYFSLKKISQWKDLRNYWFNSFPIKIIVKMWGERVKFACEVFRTEHAQIPGYPLVKDHWHTQINGRKYASQYQLNPCLRLILEYGSQEIISIESKIDGWLEFDQLHHKRPWQPISIVQK